MPNAEKLHVRMLRACHRSYHIETLADGSHEWSTQPTIIGRNPQAGLPRDLALVGIIPEGILVCCRGTQPPTLSSGPEFVSSWFDWTNNVEAAADSGHRFPGQVHKGFADAALDLWRDEGIDLGIKAGLERLIKLKPGATIYITGHSKGGALANLIASLVLGLGIASDHLAIAPGPVEVVTFAAARPGGAEFRNALNGKVKVTRYEVRTDIVPKLPPGGEVPAFVKNLLSQANVSLADSVIDFQPVGNLVSDEGQFLAALRDAASNILRDSQPIERLAVPHDIKPNSLYDKLERSRA